MRDKKAAVNFLAFPTIRTLQLIVKTVQSWNESQKIDDFSVRI